MSILFNQKIITLSGLFFGGLGGIRTLDQRLKRPLLYRLSYKSMQLIVQYLHFDTTLSSKLLLLTSALKDNLKYTLTIQPFPFENKKTKKDLLHK
jgi:hypothetical protein